MAKSKSVVEASRPQHKRLNLKLKVRTHGKLMKICKSKRVTLQEKVSELVKQFVDRNTLAA